MVKGQEPPGRVTTSLPLHLLAQSKGEVVLVLGQKESRHGVEGKTEGWRDESRLQATGGNTMAEAGTKPEKKKSGIMPDGQRFVGHREIRPHWRVKSDFRTDQQTSSVIPK